jgi:hypothetical protein
LRQRARPSPWAAFACLAAGAAAGALGALGGCETVDLGSPPADINACRPSQQFFVDQIWPNFLAKDYGGKHCYDSGCHDAAAGRPLTLAQIQPGDVGMVPLTGNWATNYKSATEQMNCSNVKASPLLAFPGGVLNHGGGMLIDPDKGPEALLIQMWVSAP